MEDICFLLDMSVGAELIDLFFALESFSSFLTSLFPWEHLESMLRVLEED